VAHSDAELVAGDPSASTDLYREHVDSVRREGHHLVGDADATSDAMDTS
jgi:hypothetical protein